MNQLVTSIIRTVTPQVAGLIVLVLLKLGIAIDSDVAMIAAMQFVAFVYYVAVRVLEQFKSTRWGVLLGKASTPVYPDKNTVVLGVPRDGRADTNPAPDAGRNRGQSNASLLWTVFMIFAIIALAIFIHKSI